MRYRLRTLLIVLTIAPPILAGAWFASGIVVRAVSHSTWEQWMPLAYQTTSLAAVIAGVTVTVALCHRSGAGYCPMYRITIRGVAAMVLSVAMVVIALVGAVLVRRAFDRSQTVRILRESGKVINVEMQQRDREISELTGQK